MSSAVLSPEDVRRALAGLPRLALAHLPTPLDEAPRFAERVGVGRVLIKRDDCTGLLFGRNKTRHNEFLVVDALRQGCDVVVWGAGIQSNNCRQTAACAKLGLESGRTPKGRAPKRNETGVSHRSPRFIRGRRCG